MSVTRCASRDIASGINSKTAEFLGILAGAGALGGVLADIWAKASWGSWTVVDPDIIEAHNIVRHCARDCLIGYAKADAVKVVVEANYSPGYFHLRAIKAKIADANNAELSDAVRCGKLLVDATTTLEVPRDLSRQEGIPRSASVFLTPSGRDSVLMLEDSVRQIRLDSLEAQYYRAVLGSQWGEGHLQGHRGDLWVGAGCRDVSAVLSFGTIQLHGAILAEQLRCLRDLTDARLCIWSIGESSSVSFSDIPIERSLDAHRDGWRVMWDEGIQRRLRSLRASELPRETGGIVLGYTDHATSTIAIVDVRAAPTDSLSNTTGFVRGKEGLLQEVETAQRLTGNVVGYIGQWHSHPPFVKPDPSRADADLLDALRGALERDGEPALMVIVGADGEVSIHVNVTCDQSN